VTVCVALAREVMNKDWLFWLVFLAFLRQSVLIGMWVCRRWPTMIVLALPVRGVCRRTQMIDTQSRSTRTKQSAPEAGLQCMSFVDAVADLFMLASF